MRCRELRAGLVFVGLIVASWVLAVAAVAALWWSIVTIARVLP